MPFGFDLFVFELFSLQNKYKGFKLIKKSDSPTMMFLIWFFKIITFGKSRFEKYHSLFGKTLFLGEDWDTKMLWVDKVLVIRHEEKHLEQIMSCSFGIFWLGFLIFSLMYLFLPLPAFFTFRGFWFEKEAYQEDMKNCARLNCEFNEKATVEKFLSLDYFYMFTWRKSVEKWFNDESIQT